MIAVVYQRLSLTGRSEYYSDLTWKFLVWRHGCQIDVPKQRNCSHVIVPNQSCGTSTLFLCNQVFFVPLILPGCWKLDCIRRSIMENWFSKRRDRLRKPEVVSTEVRLFIDIYVSNTVKINTFCSVYFYLLHKTTPWSY